MKNYFYNLNKKYLQAFKTNVTSIFYNEYLKTDESFLKIIFNQINELFSHLGRRTSSKKNIPRRGQYPDAEVFNKLLNSLEDDVDKLYTAQILIEDDLNNLLKFNSTQRANTFENLVRTQQKIMKLYIRNKKDISGEFIIGNDFQSADNKSTDSRNVDIDEVRGVLTLESTFGESKPIDSDNISIYFTGKKPRGPMYPNDDVLRAGSHWRIPGEPEAHFVDTTNPSISRNYKNMLIDTPDLNTGVGWVEFEAVKTELINHPQPVERTNYQFRDGGAITRDSFVPNVRTTFLNKDIWTLKTEAGKIAGLNKDPQLIYLDIPYSLQGINDYVGQLRYSNIETDQKEKYKLIIPFSNARLTNEIAVNFATIQGDIPKIIWSESKVYSNIEGRELAYSIIKPAESNQQSEDGDYILKFSKYIVPTRIELVLTYGGDPWHQIPFQMTHYVYSMAHSYDLPQEEGSTVTLQLGRQFDIFVDSEPNKEKEHTRALNVLTGTK